MYTEPHRVSGAKPQRVDLFQWGSTNMDNWGKQGYITTNEGYGVNIPWDKKGMESTKREAATPWSTSNASYGKALLKNNSHKLSSSQGSVTSLRSHPLYMTQTNTFPKQSLLSPQTNGNVLSYKQSREEINERLDKVANSKTPADYGFKLPELDRSKYLIAQGPPTGFKQTSTGFMKDKTNSISAPELYSTSHEAKPKTSLGRKYMRDTLDRFLNSIPENLRPKTRKVIKPREGPQVLKIKSSKRKSVIPDRNDKSLMSHAVPSASSSSPTFSQGSSSSSEEELINLDDSIYDFKQEAMESQKKQ